MARLTWGDPRDQLGFVLLALPQGGAPRVLGLPASAHWATDQTSGTPTCYVLYAVYPAGLGNTDAACAIPGQARFGSAAPAAQSAVAAGPQSARTAAAPLADQKLDHRVSEGRTKVEQEAGKLRRKGR